MTTSILDDIKMALGKTPDDTELDSEIIMHINSVFGTLTQLGIGPVFGFFIENREKTWSMYTSDPRLNAVKSYMVLCVKMLFDPPDTGFTLTMMREQKTEMEYRLNVVADYG